MPIEHWGEGGTTLTGDSIDFFRLCAQRGAVGLELKGIKMNRGPVLWRQLRDHYQIPGTGTRKASHQQVYDWLCAKVEELRLQQAHISIDPVTGRKVVEVEGKEVQ